MTYLALARKYRPRRFADLVAQDHVAAGLRGAVAKDRVAHAYLLTGPRGVGKTSAARILAMALNCEQPPADGEAGEPCGECDSCQRIWSGGANLDVVEIDAASNRGVDDARDLRERATYAASGADRHKIYIIDEAHMLTREAWNALLKILEEPPPRVVFVFATTEPQKIANTAAPVMSRVQRFDFRRLGPGTITERLEFVAASEGLDVEPDALLLMAKVAHGGMRDALSLLDQAIAFGEGQISTARVRDALGLIDDETYAQLLDLVAGRHTAEVFPFVSRLTDAGVDLAEFVGGAGEVIRALLVKQLGGEPEGLTDALREAVARRTDQFSAGDLVRMLKLLGDTETSIRRSPNARLQVEMLVLQWTLLDRTVELQDVLQALGKGGAQLTPPAAPPRRAPPRTAGSSDRTTQPRRPPRPEADAPASAPAPPPPADPTPPQPDGPVTLDGLRDAWPAVIDYVGQRRRLLREVLQSVTPTRVEGDTVGLEVADATQVEGLERAKRGLTSAIAAVTGHKVSVVLEAKAPAGGAEPATAPKRLNGDSDREKRLEMYRQKDPALDAATDALDLELLD
jgi:DNA polymerase-3 subunit gamma/tau